MSYIYIISISWVILSCHNGPMGLGKRDASENPSSDLPGYTAETIPEVSDAVLVTPTSDRSAERNTTRIVVKNDLQLRASADICLGPGLGIIKGDMFVSGLCAADDQIESIFRQDIDVLTDGDSGRELGLEINPYLENDNTKIPILGANFCFARGQHIFTILKDQLWSPDLATRSDTLSNELTANYLRALATAANIYAHGVVRPSELCDTASRARELVNRCLGLYPQHKLVNIAEVIQASCAQGASKAREAIARILGSAAFAVAFSYQGGIE